MEESSPYIFFLNWKSDYSGFQTKRVEQIAAVKSILSIPDYSKQYKLVKIVLEKLFMVCTHSIIIVYFLKVCTPIFCMTFSHCNDIH